MTFRDVGWIGRWIASEKLGGERGEGPAVTPPPVLHFLRVPERRADVLVPRLALHYLGALAGEEPPRDAAVAQRAEIDHEVRRALDEEFRCVDRRGLEELAI